VKTLLEQGADVSAAQGDGMTALHWAATHGDAELAKMLVFAGARVDAVTRNGNYTPLHLAAKAGSAPVLKALLGAGANAATITTSGGATALHFAAAQGSADAVNALIDGGAQVDATEGAFGQTPLMWAAVYDRVPAVEALIKRGASVKAISLVEDIAERERASRASAQASSRMKAALKAASTPVASGSTTPAAQGQRGAPAPAQGAGRGGQAGGGRGGAPAAGTDTIYRNFSYSEQVGPRGGLTPLLFAAREGNIKSALVLLAAGSDINQISADRTTPLLMATMNGHFDLAKALLAKGANPKLASHAGATPLYAALNTQWAAKALYPQPTAYMNQNTSYLDLMELLIKAGADVNARLTKHLWYMEYNFTLLGVNTTGATPFWRAAYGTDVVAMKLLVAHGADHKLATYKIGGRAARGDDAPVEDDAEVKDPSGLPAIPAGGPGIFPIHAASGVGYGEGFAANSHRHVSGGWLPSMKYLIEEMGHDVNARDTNGFNAIHHAAARGDNELIEYLVSKGGDVTAISRRGQTTADMANGPVQRVPPFLDTVALLEKLGSKNSHKCRSC